MIILFADSVEPSVSGWCAVDNLILIFRRRCNSQWTANRIFDLRNLDLSLTNIQRFWFGFDKPAFDAEYSSPVCQIFEYSRTNQQIRIRTVWQVHDSTSNIRIFGFDWVKMPFTVCHHTVEPMLKLTLKLTLELTWILIVLGIVVLEIIQLYGRPSSVMWKVIFKML